MVHAKTIIYCSRVGFLFVRGSKLSDQLCSPWLCRNNGIVFSCRKQAFSSPVEEYPILRFQNAPYGIDCINQKRVPFSSDSTDVKTCMDTLMYRLSNTLHYGRSHSIPVRETDKKYVCAGTRIHDHTLFPYCHSNFSRLVLSSAKKDKMITDRMEEARLSMSSEQHENVLMTTISQKLSSRATSRNESILEHQKLMDISVFPVPSDPTGVGCAPCCPTLSNNSRTCITESPFASKGTTVAQTLNLLINKFPKPRVDDSLDPIKSFQPPNVSSASADFMPFRKEREITNLDSRNSKNALNNALRSLLKDLWIYEFWINRKHARILHRFGFGRRRLLYSQRLHEQEIMKLVPNNVFAAVQMLWLTHLDDKVMCGILPDRATTFEAIVGSSYSSELLRVWTEWSRFSSPDFDSNIKSNFSILHPNDKVTSCSVRHMSPIEAFVDRYKAPLLSMPYGIFRKLMRARLYGERTRFVSRKSERRKKHSVHQLRPKIRLQHSKIKSLYFRRPTSPKLDQDHPVFHTVLSLPGLSQSCVSYHPRARTSTFSESKKIREFLMLNESHLFEKQKELECSLLPCLMCKNDSLRIYSKNTRTRNHETRRNECAPALWSIGSFLAMLIIMKRDENNE